jgi:hypothetical protein
VPAVDSAGLPALQEAIRHMHGCEATWLASEPVTETFGDETAWAGEVQVFELHGHPSAQRAYAWSHATDGPRRRFVAVLGVGPVRDAATAVRAAIVAESRK